MSSELALSVNGISKCFAIYDRPADRLRQFVLPRARRVLGLEPRAYHREFWALRDVSFELPVRRSVGIVGRNGSGKSTLLQIICGTLTPTTGQIETRGRVAALLELGSGFNPEFSGRDNVYLNAAMLGLEADEVDARFDRIAAFADIGEHLERPVKTYSSGMFVRLAFAVIAHVDADILVVDEALSVGDAVFTQRCMRFIRRFQETGTILFVSHDTAAVQSLCDTAIWIDGGRVQEIGPSRAVSQNYLRSSLQAVYGHEVALASTTPATSRPRGSPEPDVTPSQGDEEPGRARPVTRSDAQVASTVDYGSRLEVSDNLAASSGFETGMARVESVHLIHLDGTEEAMFAGGERVRIIVSVRAIADLDTPIVGFLFRDRLGQDLFGENTLVAPASAVDRVPAGDCVRAEFDFLLPMLPNGQYSVMASVASGDLSNNIQHHYLHDALVVTVSSSTVRWGLVGIPFQRVDLELERTR